ncbi:RloB family protein [Streptomyces graminilatus]|uniref:RloB family protein n=1 Tax=Streptomyces graminilatus TaxID=1464070 RepID=UPI0006E2806E|nr:RloB family protein [Streptomyces graminilatus]
MGRKGKPLQRPGSSRPEQRRFLIYCEGECTEDQYFEGLKQELRPLPVTICLGGEHGEPMSLVKSAIKHRERAPQSPADRCTSYDEVWCVVDVEAPTPHPSLDEALKLARQAGVNIALSNPCFELWILLHFRDIAAYQTSAAAQTALEKAEDCGYTVQRKHLDYNKLLGSDSARHAKAKERAEKLRLGSERGYRTNPWTDVDILVELLRQGRIRP